MAQILPANKQWEAGTCKPSNMLLAHYLKKEKKNER
jgi:hypothetical protein